MYQKQWRVVRFYTFPVFCFGSLLKAILEHLGIDFWGFWAPFSMIVRIKGVINILMIFYVVFFQFLFDFGLQVGTRPAHDSGGICLLRPPRVSWRGCFGFVSLLASFWDHFGSTWSWILSLFRRILVSMSLFFDIVFQLLGYMFALSLVPSAFNHEPQS